jgi:hypothetical protein
VTLKLRRLGDGAYQSPDGRVLICREVSHQTYRADEISWSLCIDGKCVPRDFETKREAVLAAAKRLARPEEQP